MKRILSSIVLILMLTGVSFAKKPLDIADSIMIVSQDGSMTITSINQTDIVIIDGKFAERPQDVSQKYENVNLTQSGNFTIGKETIPLYITE